MKISLYINRSSEEHVNKNLEFIITLDGYFRIANSLKNPEIDIESNGYVKHNYGLSYPIEVDDEIIYEDIDDVSILEDISILKCNYIYIEDFNRYYYVSDIVILNNRIYRFILFEDVLMSLKNEFLKLDGIVARNEFTYNINIEDEKEPFEFYQNTIEYNLGNNGLFNTILDPASTNYYISTIEKGASYDGNSIQGIDSNLPAVRYTVAGINKFKKAYATTVVNVNNLADSIVDHEDYGTFIASLIAYPFNIETDNNYENLTLGNTLIPDVLVWPCKDSQSKYYKAASFRWNDYNIARGFLAYEPYSKYEIYLPYYGYIELKSSDFKDSTIDIYYSFDYENGTAKINVLNSTKNYIIKSVTANIGVKISISRTNNQELSDEKTQLAIKSTISGLAGVAQIAAGAYTGNAFLVAGGAQALTSTAIDISSKLNMMHEKAQTSNNTGLEGLYGSQNVKLKFTRYVTKEPSNYAKIYGRPLNNRAFLSDLHGYTVVSDIHLDNMDATKEELDELKSLLKTGVVL